MDWYLDFGFSLLGFFFLFGGGLDSGGLWRGEDDDEVVVVEM